MPFRNSKLMHLLQNSFGRLLRCQFCLSCGFSFHPQCLMLASCSPTAVLLFSEDRSTPVMRMVVDPSCCGLVFIRCAGGDAKTLMFINLSPAPDSASGSRRVLCIARIARLCRRFCSLLRWRVR